MILKDFERFSNILLQSGAEMFQAMGRQYSIGSRVVAESRQISEGGFAYVWLVRVPRAGDIRKDAI